MERRCYWDGNPCDCKGTCQKDPFLEEDDEEPVDITAYRQSFGLTWNAGADYE
jgi:hypothetical protein